MTADVELLPMPEWLAERDEKTKLVARNYARTVAEHNMAELADDRDDLLARLDASIDHGTKLGAAQQRCLDEVLEQQAEIEALRAEVKRLTDFNADTCEAFNRLSVERTALITRAERLAEALRLYISAGFGNSTDFYKQAGAKRAAIEALHPAAAQEGE